MWIYQQFSGKLYDRSGAEIGAGYSGNGEGLNNPEFEKIPDVGPIPQGTYHIGPAYGHTEHGPVVMKLTPFSSNEMFGRSEFLMHGDLVSAPGKHEASKGCIIMDLSIRAAVARSVDKELKVIA